MNLLLYYHKHDITIILGITSKLDHLKELGIGGVWMSPIFKSPMADFGYDISDFYEIEPIFGTMADFEALVTRANELGKQQGVLSSKWFVA